MPNFDELDHATNECLHKAFESLQKGEVVNLAAKRAEQGKRPPRSLQKTPKELGEMFNLDLHDEDKDKATIDTWYHHHMSARGILREAPPHVQAQIKSLRTAIGEPDEDEQ